ncbi:MAG: nitrile hydratase subunit beta, partial [Bacillota bacterium]
MNTVHDMGGMQNFGPVTPEPDEPWFHGDWERKVFAMTLAMGATKQWNLDQSRAARESLPPAQYLASTYYETWFAGLRKLLEERGLLSAEKKNVAKLTGDRVEAALRNRLGVARPAPRPARFAAGDRVVTRNIN